MPFVHSWFVPTWRRLLKGEGAPEKLLPVRPGTIRRWERMSIDRKVADNLQRIDRHVLTYEQVRDKPRRPGTARAYVLVFMHVPKTGGTTLEYLLAKNYTVNGTLHINAPALANNPYALFKKGDLPHVVMGHHKLSHVLYRFIDRRLVHITMLRDPVKRVLSYFDYLQTSKGHGLHDKAKQRDLEAFVESDDMVELANAQTMRIAGYLAHSPGKHADADRALAQAKEHLARRFTLFGLTERYPAFLLMGRRVLGWRDIFHQSRNISKKKTRPEDVDAGILDRIRERNQQDIELYEFARDLFDQRCAELGIDEDTLSRFHERNAQYQELINTDEF